MSILCTREVIHFKDELNIQEVNEFRSLLDKIETNFISNSLDKEIQVGDLTFPIRGRPRTMCRWYISSRRNMLYYNCDIDEFVYKEPDSIGQMVTWLKYLIQHFFAPKGIILNGKMEIETVSGIYWGFLIIKYNEVSKKIFEQMIEYD